MLPEIVSSPLEAPQPRLHRCGERRFGGRGVGHGVRDDRRRPVKCSLSPVMTFCRPSASSPPPEDLRRSRAMLFFSKGHRSRGVTFISQGDLYSPGHRLTSRESFELSGTFCSPRGRYELVRHPRTPSTAAVQSHSRLMRRSSLHVVLQYNVSRSDSRADQRLFGVKETRPIAVLGVVVEREEE